MNNARPEVRYGGNEGKASPYRFDFGSILKKVNENELARYKQRVVQTQNATSLRAKLHKLPSREVQYSYRTPDRYRLVQEPVPATAKLSSTQTRRNTTTKYLVYHATTVAT
eukprot:scaffold465010_cov31-Prasinocladus_malaysianus.AAC.1